MPSHICMINILLSLLDIQYEVMFVSKIFRSAKPSYLVGLEANLYDNPCKLTWTKQHTLECIHTLFKSQGLFTFSGVLTNLFIMERLFHGE